MYGRLESVRVVGLVLLSSSPQNFMYCGAVGGFHIVAVTGSVELMTVN